MGLSAILPWVSPLSAGGIAWPFLLKAWLYFWFAPFCYLQSTWCCRTWDRPCNLDSCMLAALARSSGRLWPWVNPERAGLDPAAHSCPSLPKRHWKLPRGIQFLFKGTFSPQWKCSAAGHSLGAISDLPCARWCAWAENWWYETLSFWYRKSVPEKKTQNKNKRKRRLPHVFEPPKTWKSQSKQSVTGLIRLRSQEHTLCSAYKEVNCRCKEQALHAECDSWVSHPGCPPAATLLMNPLTLPLFMSLFPTSSLHGQGTKLQITYFLFPTKLAQLQWSFCLQFKVGLTARRK